MEGRQETGLVVSGIRKGYEKGHPLWENISFELMPGEALGIQGTNGAGKSTLLRVLATLEQPEQGEIRYLGKDIYRGEGKRQYRAALGYVPQEIALYPELTGLENLRFFGRVNHVPAEELEVRIQRVCTEVQIGEEILSKKTVHCSGGMKRRLNLAAALLHEPQILLLDEPVVGVDEESRQIIWQTLRRKREEGASILYVTHEVQELQAVCGRRARLTEGKWLEDGEIE